MMSGGPPMPVVIDISPHAAPVTAELRGVMENLTLNVCIAMSETSSNTPMKSLSPSAVIAS